ncbi:MAG TPA: hypothetical protein VKY90_06850 [Candidatus Dormibacteraeota bacterium]|nr:hypothetical protein [Candidatus Dormibacteraeota bacterium]
MPSAAMLAPPALLAVAAILACSLGQLAAQAGRVIGALAAWLAIGVEVAGWWWGGRVPLEFTAPISLGGVPLGLKLDSSIFALQTVTLLALALLLTFQPQGSGRAALASLAGGVALSTLAANSLALTALGLSACAGLLRVALAWDEQEAVEAAWGTLSLAWIVLLWAAVLLEVVGGTSVYSAVPVTALQVPVFLLVAVAALLCTGALPWRTWVSLIWARERPAGGTLALAVMVPLGFSLLLRAYALGAGEWPASWLHSLLTGLGALTALAAAGRAQAAGSVRMMRAEALPLGAGLTLMALALGTPLGVAAAVLSLGGLGLTTGLLPSLPDEGPAGSIGDALVFGTPPALVFGGWLLCVQAALEAGPMTGLMGLAGALAWLVGLAAVARATWLPPPTVPRSGSLTGFAAGVGLLLAGGVGLGGLTALVAMPVASDLMSPSSHAPAIPYLGGGVAGVVAPSGNWPAGVLGGVVAAVGVALLCLAGLFRRRGWGLRQRSSEPAEARARGHRSLPILEVGPFLDLSWWGLPVQAAMRLRGLRLPSQYRSLVRLRALGAATMRSRPWFWALVTVALALVVTR